MASVLVLVGRRCWCRLLMASIVVSVSPGPTSRGLAISCRQVWLALDDAANDVTDDLVACTPRSLFLLHRAIAPTPPNEPPQHASCRATSGSTRVVPSTAHAAPFLPYLPCCFSLPFMARYHSHFCECFWLLTREGRSICMRRDNFQLLKIEECLHTLKMEACLHSLKMEEYLHSLQGPIPVPEGPRVGDSVRVLSRTGGALATERESSIGDDDGLDSELNFDEGRVAYSLVQAPTHLF